jgi:hypothetical protein
MSGRAAADVLATFAIGPSGGRAAESITWITPFEVIMSVFTTLAPDTRDLAAFEPTNKFAPFTVPID